MNCVSQDPTEASHLELAGRARAGFQERVSLSARSLISREVESGRPLAFLRHNLGKELEKPLG
jgi:hypothetical protein